MVAKVHCLSVDLIASCTDPVAECLSGHDLPERPQHVHGCWAYHHLPHGHLEVWNNSIWLASVWEPVVLS